MHEKIDKKFYIGPEIDGRCVIEELSDLEIYNSSRHPNKNEHKWLAETLHGVYQSKYL